MLILQNIFKVGYCNKPIVVHEPDNNFLVRQHLTTFPIFKRRSNNVGIAIGIIEDIFSLKNSSGYSMKDSALGNKRQTE